MDLSVTKTGNLDEMSASLFFDLESHIDAYRSGDSNSLKESHYQLNKELNNYHFIFANLINEAMIGQPEENIKIIKSSPAFYYIKKEFCEILKNAIDSKLKPFENQDYNSLDTILKLDIKIELDPNKQYIRFMVADNGTGFAEDKLLLIKNKEAREASDYYTHVGSEKRGLERHKKLLIGGAGRGIKELIGLADKGDPTYGLDVSENIIIESEKRLMRNDRAENITFEVPEISLLSFYNKNNENGAVIDIFTSTKPLVFNKIAEKEETVILELSVFKKKRNTSPNTVTKSSDSDDDSIKNSPK